MKVFHLRPVDLRYDFGDEFAHLPLEADLRLAKPSTVASPIYTFNR